MEAALGVIVGFVGALLTVYAVETPSVITRTDCEAVLPRTEQCTKVYVPETLVPEVLNLMEKAHESRRHPHPAY